MPFYKFRLQQGHHGRGQFEVLRVYIYAKDFASARENAKRLPSVKHTSSRCVLEGKIIEEQEFVWGIIQNAYARIEHKENILNTIEQISRRLDRIKGYEWQTMEGKELASYCTMYKQAKGDKQKLKIEQEYYAWAQKLVDSDVYGI